MARQVTELSNLTATGGTNVVRGPYGTSFNVPGNPPVGSWFYGVLVNAGPGGDADFTDARYWVETVTLAQAAGAVSTDLTSAYLDNYSYESQWLVATNLGEALAGTHTLPVIAPSPDASIPLPMGATLVRVQMINAGKMTTDPTEHANVTYVFAPITNEVSGPIWAKLTAVSGTVPAPGAYTAQTYDGLTTFARVRNLLEIDWVGSPGSQGVTIGSNGTVNGTACAVKYLGTNAPVMLMRDPTVSGGWAFSSINWAE